MREGRCRASAASKDSHLSTPSNLILFVKRFTIEVAIIVKKIVAAFYVSILGVVRYGLNIYSLALLKYF